MKKYVLIVVALFLCLSMLACDKQPVPPETSGIGEVNGSIEPSDTGDVNKTASKLEDGGWVGTRSFSTSSVFTEDGYYYIMDGSLFFLDVSNGINIPLCNKIGCKHIDMGYESGNPLSCEALITNGNIAGFYDGHLYFARYEEEGYVLYRRNADGTGEERLLVLCEEYVAAQKAVDFPAFFMGDGYLYYQANIISVSVPQPGVEAGEISEVVIMQLDLRTMKEATVISFVAESSISLTAHRRDALIYIDQYFDPEYYTLDIFDPKRDELTQESIYKVYFMDVSTGEKTLIMEKPWADNFGIILISGDTMLYRIREGEEYITYSRDLKTGEDKQLYNGDIAYLNEDYCFTFILEGETEKYTLMNLKTGQLLPTAYQAITLYLHDIGDKGIILIRRVTQDDSSRVRIYSYIAFADLADGLQEEDFVDFYTK